MRALAVAALVACSGPKDAFECTGNDSCRNGSIAGTCEATGFCSFPDPSCPSGARYGDAAGGGLAGQCVGPPGSDGGVVDPAAIGAWQVATAVPVPRYTHATATNGNFIYVFGGISGSTGRSDVWVASVNQAAIEPMLAITAWTQTTSLPANRRTFGAAYDAGYVYVFGGRTDLTADTPDVLVAPVNLDGTIGAWTAAAALPESVKCEAIAASGSHVYLIGGKSAGVAKAFVLRAELANGTVGPWQLATNLDETVFDHAAVTANGFLYVIGGCASGNNMCNLLLDTVEVARINADGSLGTFTHTTSLPMPRSHHTAAVSSRGDVYVLGGTYGAHLSDPSTTDVVGAHLNADGSVGAWTAMQPLPNGRRRATAAAIGSYLLLVHADTQVAQFQ